MVLGWARMRTHVSMTGTSERPAADAAVGFSQDSPVVISPCYPSPLPPGPLFQFSNPTPNPIQHPIQHPIQSNTRFNTQPFPSTAGSILVLLRPLALCLMPIIHPPLPTGAFNCRRHLDCRAVCLSRRHLAIPSPHPTGALILENPSHPHPLSPHLPFSSGPQAPS